MTSINKKIAVKKKSLLSWHIWKGPIILNCIATFGIVAALLGDFWLDGLAWVSIGATLIVIYYLYQRN